ncbi:MAG: CopG family transcriptional regulator [Bacteroidetes bacterium]|nr:CopG family transcriptional regulator [Bacteroidota bacterium]
MHSLEFDTKFDEGEDIAGHLDLSQAARLQQGQKRVNVDFPIWMVQKLDQEAKKLGVTRQSIIKVRIADKLKEVK